MTEFVRIAENEPSVNGLPHKDLLVVCGSHWSEARVDWENRH